MCLLAMLGCRGFAAAQPSECPSYPAATQTVRLQLDLAGLPGVPTGLVGQLFADVPASPPGGTVCAAARRSGPVTDALAVKPGLVLSGAPAADLLRGR